MNQQAFEVLFSDFDPFEAFTSIIDFLRRNWQERLNRRDFVLGLSGGIDSAVVAALITKAEIPLHVVMLPDGYRPDANSIDKASMMVKYCAIPKDRIHIRDLKPMLDTRCGVCDTGKSDRCGLCRGNRAARERMAELYDIASKFRGIVSGTENLTEYFLGYFTLHGDAASDIEPIHGLLKTEVQMLAKYLGVPEPIIAQPPSAELWAGQTDEGELGFSYAVADSVLKTEENPAKLAKLGISREEHLKVVDRINSTLFKRREKPVWNMPGRNLRWA